MTALIAPGVSPVYANWGRWVADCSYLHRCDGAMRLQPFTPGFVCVDCGGLTEVVWPAADMVEGVERLLMMRPHPKTRNWLPTETLVDLLTENVTHGVMDGLDWGGVPLMVSDFRIAKDELPQARPELTGGR